jgi:hypothetical protein
MGQIRLTDDEGHRHQKLELEKGGFLGPVTRSYASRYLITGRVKPNDRVGLYQWQYDQSLLPIRFSGTHAFHFDRYRRDP